jgi:hypothetical protein
MYVQLLVTTDTELSATAVHFLPLLLHPSHHAYL